MSATTLTLAIELCTSSSRSSRTAPPKPSVVSCPCTASAVTARPLSSRLSFEEELPLLLLLLLLLPLLPLAPSSLPFLALLLRFSFLVLFQLNKLFLIVGPNLFVFIKKEGNRHEGGTRHQALLPQMSGRHGELIVS